MLSNEDAQLVAMLRQAATRFAQREAAGDQFAAGKAAICRDIAARTERYERFASLRQRSYAVQLVAWSQPNQRSQTATSVALQIDSNADRRELLMNTLAVNRIVGLFQAARESGLSFPRIRLQRGEWKIRIYPAPASGRNAGSFYVKAKSGTGRDIYQGTIRPDGTFRGALGGCALDVLEALREFSENPERVAAAYGRQTGHCCFCGLTLTDSRSVAMGYGPICAENYGLPWGDRRATEGAVRLTPNVPLDDPRHAPWRELDQARRRRASEPSFDSVQVANTPQRLPRPAPLSNVPLDEEDEDKHFM